MTEKNTKTYAIPFSVAPMMDWTESFLKSNS